jgi:hypothetical protein
VIGCAMSWTRRDQTWHASLDPLTKRPANRRRTSRRRRPLPRRRLNVLPRRRLPGPNGVERFYAVLHLGGIRSPLDAMRAAIVAERKSAG